jgi:hypothetical protein
MSFSIIFKINNSFLSFFLISSILIVNSSFVHAEETENQKKTNSPINTQDIKKIADSFPSFNSLHMPVSPAFSLLGISPTSIEKPTTPSTLALTILNTSNNLTSLPQNFAMEFSPYWMFYGSKLSWRQDIERDILESITRTSTMSIATAQTGDDANPVTSLGISYRTSIFSGKLSDKSKSYLEKIESNLNVRLLLFDKYSQMQSYKEKFNQADELTRNAANEIDKKKREELLDKANKLSDETTKLILNDSNYRDELNSTVGKDLEKITTQREGFFMDFSLATAMNFPKADASQGTLNKSAAWFTFSQEWEQFSIVGLTRGILEHTKNSGLIDLGIRPVFNKDLYAISLELISRIPVNNSSLSFQWRLMSLLDYKIADNTWLNIGVGKDYDNTMKGTISVSFNYSTFDTFDKFAPSQVSQ